MDTQVLKILIVDDHSGTLNGLRAGLTSMGFEIITASGGSEALMILNELIRRREIPDLLLTDYKMAKMNGIDLIHTAKAMTADLPAILMTGYGDKWIKKKLKQLARCGYIDKPFHPEALVNLIHALVLEQQRA